jgi:hypothetical protein
MKPLILILLTSSVAISVQAQTQTIADIARNERARKAQIPSKSNWVVRTEDIRTTPPAEEETASPEGVAAPSPAAEAPAPATPSTVDPAQQWYDETALVRAKVRDLTDQETASQLQINNLMNQVLAPQSTQSARDQAQSELQAAQQRLQGVRTELEKTRGELQARELQGPPKK